MSSLGKPNRWAHQDRALNFLNERDFGMLAAGMGTGKTRVAYDYLAEQDYNYALVLTTKKGIEVWRDQFYKYAKIVGDDQRVRSLFYSPTDLKSVHDKRAFFLQAIRDSNTIVVMNYEMFWRKPYIDLMMLNPPDIIIADESHKLKSVSGRASKAAWKLGRLAKKRFALTGTPFHHSTSDIFGQFRFLSDEVLGRAHGKFRQQYEVLKPLGAGVLITVGHKNQSELADKLRPHMLVITREEAIELPSEIETIIPFKLSSAGAKAYKELKEDYITKLDEGVITIGNALVAALRLQQLTGGFVKLDNGNGYRQLDTEKLAALSDLVDSIGRERYVVFARFTLEIQAIKGALLNLTGEMPLEISGSTNEYDEWKRTDHQGIVVQIQSGSEAIDLTEARYAFYYSLPNSLGQFDQSKARISRPGADLKKTVNFYYLLATHTVDEIIHRALATRTEVNQALIKEIRYV